ncbi:glycosyltransferase 87 family protein [Streptomyces sp. NPDC048172]|uniref:glycosyltransferase 87 family protein n=1 Tax=Streptomyces sp. NPDC048172 TaxID=3365505 RepID=UPI00371FF024
MARAVRAKLLTWPYTIALVACALSFAAFWLAQRASGVSMIDLMVYRAEGWTVRNGDDLYAMRATDSDLPMTYPPFAALLFLPLTMVGVPDMRALATLANLVLLVALIHLSLRLAGRPLRVPRPAAALFLASFAVWCEPVWTTLRYGQINLLLAVLVLWDLSRSRDHRWAGVGIGIAAGIKLTPALFVVLLAICGSVRSWRHVRHVQHVRHTGRGATTVRAVRAADLWNPWLRQAAVATAAFLATVLLAALVLPRDSLHFWTETLFESGRVGRTENSANQSLSGVVARLLHTPEPGGLWAVLAALVVVLGLAVAVAAALAGPRRLPHAPAWAAMACAVTALLVSPVSWSHHWVWCVPMVVLLGAEAHRRSSARWWAGTAVTGLVFLSYAPWLVPQAPAAPLSVSPELHQNGGQMLLSAIYPLAGAVFLTVAAVLSVRALRTDTPRPAPHETGRTGPQERRAEAASECLARRGAVRLWRTNRSA